MNICSIGVLTFQTRVEAWECDHNQHWNVRQYMRCFQQAGFVAADLGSSTPGLDATVTQHSRYHRELMQTAPVEIRSSVLEDGEHAGAVVHILSSEGRLSATALEFSDYETSHLPGVKAADIALALPRGIRGGQHDRPDGPVEINGKIVEHGFIQPREADHQGSLGLDWLMARIAAASNELLANLGFTPEFVRENAITRMGVETRLTRFGHLPAGTRLCSAVKVSEVGRKNIVLRHSFFKPDGTALAASDQSLVTVNLKTRRACELPEFLQNAAVEA